MWLFLYTLSAGDSPLFRGEKREKAQMMRALVASTSINTV